MKVSTAVLTIHSHSRLLSLPLQLFLCTLPVGSLAAHCTLCCMEWWGYKEPEEEGPGEGRTGTSERSHWLSFVWRPTVKRGEHRGWSNGLTDHRKGEGRGVDSSTSLPLHQLSFQLFCFTATHKLTNLPLWGDQSKAGNPSVLHNTELFFL